MLSGLKSGPGPGSSGIGTGGATAGETTGTESGAGPGASGREWRGGKIGLQGHRKAPSMASPSARWAAKPMAAAMVGAIAD